MRNGKPNLPNNGEAYCKKCAVKRHSFSKFINHHKGICELAKLKEERVFFRLTDHAAERLIQRQLNVFDIKKAFKKQAWLVERQDSLGKTVLVLLLHINKEPVHIVICYTNKPDAVLVLTVYDPRLKPWMWTSDYKQRVCWCKDQKKATA